MRLQKLFGSRAREGGDCANEFVRGGGRGGEGEGSGWGEEKEISNVNKTCRGITGLNVIK